MSDEVLPPGWAQIEIEDCLLPYPNGKRIRQGWSPQCEDHPAQSHDEWAVLRTSAIQDGSFVEAENKKLPRQLEPRPHLEVQAGDILITCAGPRSRCGVTCLVRATRPRLLISGKMYQLRADPGVIDRHYLELFLRESGARKKIDEMKTGISDSGLNLTHDRFRTLTIPLPPLAEQKRIVAKIEELFSELEAGEESLRVARRQLGVYRQSLLQQAFAGKLTKKWRTQNPAKLESPAQLLARIQSARQAYYEEQVKDWEAAVKAWESSGQKGKRPAKPSEPASTASKEFEGLEVPQGWAVEQIGNCQTDALIGLVRSADVQHAGPAGFRYIKMDRVDMQGNTDLDADVFVECTPDEVVRFSLRKGDILFNTRNSVELVGKVGIVRRDPETPTVYNNNLMRLRLPDCLDPFFVGLQLCAQPFRQRMEKVKKATTSVAAVYGKDFWPLPVVLCSLPEQQEIVRLLDAQFEVVARNEREIDAALQRSAALRQAILKKAFTGRLVPQDPSDEPATQLLARLRAERTHEPPRRRATLPRGD